MQNLPSVVFHLQMPCHSWIHWIFTTENIRLQQKDRLRKVEYINAIFARLQQARGFGEVILFCIPVSSFFVCGGEFTLKFFLFVFSSLLPSSFISLPGFIKLVFYRLSYNCFIMSYVTDTEYWFKMSLFFMAFCLWNDSLLLKPKSVISFRFFTVLRERAVE